MVIPAAFISDSTDDESSRCAGQLIARRRRSFHFHTGEVEFHDLFHVITLDFKPQCRSFIRNVKYNALRLFGTVMMAPT